MKFWRGNKIANEFEMPAAKVADKFMEWAKSEGVAAEMLAGLPLERVIRWWLTDTGHFNSVWVAEKADGTGETFDDLYLAIRDRVYPGE